MAKRKNKRIKKRDIKKAFSLVVLSEMGSEVCQCRLEKVNHIDLNSGEGCSVKLRTSES